MFTTYLLQTHHFVSVIMNYTSSTTDNGMALSFSYSPKLAIQYRVFSHCTRTVGPTAKAIS